MSVITPTQDVAAAAQPTSEAKDGAIAELVSALDAFMAASYDDVIAVELAEGELTAAARQAERVLRPVEILYAVFNALRAVHQNAVAVSKHVADVRAMTYRGIYEDAATYDRNNVVTRGGGMWVALRDGVKGITPGDGSLVSTGAWRLSVSRGKEGKQGKQGPQGAPGRDLRWEDRE